MENKDCRHRRILSEVHECVQKENDFLITTHINPDGDSVASILVFASILRHLEKTYLVVLDDNVPNKFDFLPRIDEIIHFKEQAYPLQPKVLVVLDSSDLERIGKVREIITSDVRIINIDHHTSNQEFGNINVVAEEESSTVEIVYALLSLWEIPMSKEIATFVYTGIMCDTGRFRFPNTTHRSLMICSEMVRMGASPDRIAKNLYCRMSQETIRALAAALSTIEFHLSGAVCCIHLPYSAFPMIDRMDTEGFVDYVTAVEGTEVGFFMLEKKPNLFRISFRSKSCVDVNEVAQTFGGGGHTRASGCTIEGRVDQVRARVLDVLRGYM